LNSSIRLFLDLEGFAIEWEYLFNVKFDN